MFNNNEDEYFEYYLYENISLDYKLRAKGTQLKLQHIRLTTKEISENNVIQILKAIHNVEKPILIQCCHGSDQTVIKTTACRIIFENWTKEDTFAEFKPPEFEYHEKWYPHLLDILKKQDIYHLETELNI